MQLNVRVSGRERALVVERAGAAGMSVGDFVREALKLTVGRATLEERLARAEGELADLRADFEDGAERLERRVAAIERFAEGRG